MVKTRRPSESNSGVGVGVRRQLKAQQSGQPLCATGRTAETILPMRSVVGVGVPVCVGVPVIVGVWVIVLV